MILGLSLRSAAFSRPSASLDVPSAHTSELLPIAADLPTLAIPDC
jgi:hypothetical protein